MIPKTVWLPTFKLSQVNKRDDGSIIPHLEILSSNMAANVDAMEAAGTPDSDNVIYICIKEKLDDGDYLCAIAAMPLNKDIHDLVDVQLRKFKKVPHIVISSKPGIVDVIKKVLKNIIFS